jgi:hypothetical protein
VIGYFRRIGQWLVIRSCSPLNNHGLWFESGRALGGSHVWARLGLGRGCPWCGVMLRDFILAAPWGWWCIVPRVQDEIDICLGWPTADDPRATTSFRNLKTCSIVVHRLTIVVDVLLRYWKDCCLPKHLHRRRRRHGDIAWTGHKLGISGKSWKCC